MSDNPVEGLGPLAELAQEICEDLNQEDHGR